MARNSSLSAKISKKRRQTRINWEGPHADYIMKLFVKEYKRYKANKSATAVHWAEKLGKIDAYKQFKITDTQIKNFVASQITRFHRAVEKRDSTGFGDDEKLGTAEEQLIKISKYWYNVDMHN